MREVHFVIDEAGTVLKGGMPAVEEALVVGRSYGVRLNLIYQSLAQLKETMPGKEAIVLGNTEKILFGTNDLGTADYVSKMLGSQTITVEDASTSTSWQRSGGENGGASSSRSASRSWKEQGRELLKPDEVLNLHPDLILAFIRGMRPIMAWRVKWYQDWRFGGEGEKRQRFRLPVWWLLLACAGAAIIWALWN